MRSTIRGFGSRVKANGLRYFSGNASGDGIARVQIALVGVKYGAQAATRRKSPRCVQINSKRQVFQRKPVARKCSRLEWLTVDGTRSWTFYLGRNLPKGNYTLYSRAVGDGGATEGNFSTTNGNKLAFTVT
jgi:hypothetical protein